MHQNKNQKDYWAKLEPGQVYHIYNHAVGDDDLFREPENYAFFLRRWKDYWQHYMDVYAYCLMPNHFHVVGRLKPLSETVKEAIQKENTSKAAAYLSGEAPANAFYEDQFKRFFTSYSRAFGKSYQRVGSLFRAKFKRIIIRNKEHLLDKIFYVHHNPIHHGFCTGYADYPYSSYHDYLEENGTWVHLSILAYFGNSRPAALAGFVQAHEKYRLGFSDFGLVIG
jgi:REP element-mobilizing transposase RayT